MAKENGLHQSLIVMNDIFPLILSHFLVISWLFLGHFLVILWSFCGHFLVIFWSFFGHFLVIFWSFFGHFLVIFWSFFGHFLVISWLFLGHFLVISWSFLIYAFGPYFCAENQTLLLFSLNFNLFQKSFIKLAPFQEFVKISLDFFRDQFYKTFYYRN